MKTLWLELAASLPKAQTASKKVSDMHRTEHSRGLTAELVSGSSSYHFSDEQHSFPGGGELFARKNREENSLARPSGVGSLDVPHGRKTVRLPPKFGSKRNGLSVKTNLPSKKRKLWRREAPPRWKRKQWQRGNAAWAQKKKNICGLQMWNPPHPAACIAVPPVTTSNHQYPAQKVTQVFNISTTFTSIWLTVWHLK